MGLPKDHPSRIETGLVYVLNEAINDGHVFLPRQLLIEKANKLLDIDTNLTWEGLERLIKDDRVKQERLEATEQEIDTQTTAKSNSSQDLNGEVAIYLTPYYYSEISVAELISQLLKHVPKPKQDPLVFESTNLSEEQKAALELALSNPVSIITGGPGTGKTTCLQSLIHRLEANNIRYALASPTGRAAKRLSEATSRPASTIHRLLAYSPAQGFQYHEKKPLNIDFLVIDEASMLDLMLTFHLLRAVKPGTQVLFVGDVDQLPSVGAGDVLRDLIASQMIPVSRLDTIYRQTEDSQIIANAHRINHGLIPEFSSSGSGDFFLFPAEDAQQAATWIVDLVSSRIPERFNLDPVKDIQTLTPIYRGAAGVDNLNDNLQDVLNPANSKKAELKMAGRIFRVGDKVMQTRNNYDKDIYNGDIGTVTAINRIDQTLSVLIDGVKEIEYDFSEADELVLAYAVSIHKSQGSEFPAVVIPILTQHYIMLQRNLLYTAVTRAKSVCVLVGNVRAAHIAINNNKISLRNTLLSNRIKLH
jgi:exodeoxyribonuclease V alpha subunit